MPNTMTEKELRIMRYIPCKDASMKCNLCPMFLPGEEFHYACCALITQNIDKLREKTDEQISNFLRIVYKSTGFDFIHEMLVDLQVDKFQCDMQDVLKLLRFIPGFSLRVK